MLGFMSSWSIGVGVLSSMLLTSGGLLWLFIFTHGGTEVDCCLGDLFVLPDGRTTVRR